jgi:NTE family protein
VRTNAPCVVYVLSIVDRCVCCASLLCVLLVLSACTSAPHKVERVIAPSTAPTEPKSSANRKVAFVLGGGAARGFAHVGAIKVLEAHGIRPDLIVGTSAGSFVGALYAAGHSAQQLEQIALETQRRELVDYSLGWFGLIKGEALQEYVDKHIDRRPIEALPTAFAAVATDFQTGQLKIFNRGDVGMAVRASSSIPGVFHPVVIDGRRYVDGSLVSPLPVCVARHLGADFVIAIDVWYPPQHTSISNPLNIPFQIVHIMAQALSAHQAEAADVAIKPNIGGDISFSDKQTLINAGERAANAALPEIKAQLADSSRPHRRAASNACPPLHTEIAQDKELDRPRENR